MTQNLAILDKTLTPSDSDVNQNFVLPKSVEDPKGSDCFSQQNVAKLYLNKEQTKWGVYYNWFTATAGQGTSSWTQGETQYSICPKGWKLPTQTEYESLVSSVGGYSNMRNAPQNFSSASGDWRECYQYSAGFYTTSTPGQYNTSVSRLIIFPSGSGYVSDGNETNNKAWGFNARCVKR